MDELKFKIGSKFDGLKSGNVYLIVYKSKDKILNMYSLYTKFNSQMDTVDLASKGFLFHSPRKSLSSFHQHCHGMSGLNSMLGNYKNDGWNINIPNKLVAMFV